MNTGMNFSESLSKYRKATGISQEKLAEMLGVSRQAVSKWETGETQPEMANLLAICKILKVTPDELLGYESIDRKETVTGEKDIWKGKKAAVAFIAVILAVILLITGVRRLKTLTGRESSPLEGRDRLEITGFDYEFTGDSENNLILTFVPGLSSEDFKYEVVRTDDSGNTEVFDANYNEGVCTCSVQTIPYEKVTFTVKISDGSITLSQALFTVTDEGDNFYTHEELWDR